MRRRSVSLVTFTVLTMSIGAAHPIDSRGDSTGFCTVAEDATVSCVEPSDTPLAPDVTSPLQAIVDAAAPGTTILVAPGDYVGVLTFRGKNVTLRTTDGPEVTTIDGAGGTTANRPLIDIGPGGSLIGFTIRNGRANFGGGMAVHGAGSVVQGNIFRENKAYSGGSGAAIYGNSASPRIEGNTFRSNSCEGYSTSGIVTFFNYSSPTIVNNVFEDNSLDALSFVIPVGYSPVVINNTIVRNGVGVYVYRNVNSGLLVFENNAIVANGKGLLTEYGTEAYNPTWKNNLLFGNTVNYTGIADQTGQNGNIVADPQFIDTAGGDYHVVLGSPAIDAGDNNAPRLSAMDYDGEVRIRDGNGDSSAVIDIGADEYTWRNRKPVAIPGPDRTLECQDAPTVEIVLDGSASTDPDSTSGTNDDIVAFDWFEGFGTPSQSPLGSGAHLKAYLSGGTHRVTLRLTDRGGLVGTASLTVDVRGRSECDDGNPCTYDSVTPTCGCNHVPTPESVCDDSNPCTSLGLCNAAGVCVGAAPVNCDDRNVCTEDSCKPATGCVHKGLEGRCDDANPCTKDDTCTSSFCRGVPMDDGASCDDLNACTDNDTCTFGYCQGIAVDNGKSCDRHSPCASGGGSCYYGTCYLNSLPNGTACEDGNPCTSGERCSSGSCRQSVPFVEPPGSPLSAVGPVSVGDFNLDGNPDLVTQRSNNPSVLVILLGDGSGGFAQVSSVSFAAASYGAFTAVADFNLDGKPDFAAVQNDAQQSNVVAFLGDGAGRFAAAADSVPVDGYMRAFATGDFNNDGKPDLAAASQFTKNVTILLGDGHGGFAARTPVAAGSLPQGLATGDFNRDGKLDVAVANPVTNGGVTIMLGDGSGGLAPYTQYAAGPGPGAITVADLDGDGNPDLAVADADFATSKISILRGDGHGGFDVPYQLEAGGYSPSSIFAADLDLDGQLDLATGFGGESKFEVLVGNGTFYSFQQADGSPIQIPGRRVDIVLADLDRDGRPDVIAWTTFPYDVRIFLNRSTGGACPRIDGCATNTCDRSTGQCTPAAKSFPSACDDHNACTTNDSCVDGICRGPVVSGLSCDDGSECTSGDTCDAGACSGTAVPVPPEVGRSVQVSRVGGDARVTWIVAPGATSSSVLRGRLSSLPVGSTPGDESCIASRVSSAITSAPDAEVPAEDSGFWYLVRAENACVAGPYGYQGQNGFATVPEVGASCP